MLCLRQNRQCLLVSLAIPIKNISIFCSILLFCVSQYCLCAKCIRSFLLQSSSCCTECLLKEHRTEGELLAITVPKIPKPETVFCVFCPTRVGVINRHRKSKENHNILQSPVEVLGGGGGGGRGWYLVLFGSLDGIEPEPTLDQNVSFNYRAFLFQTKRVTI